MLNSRSLMGALEEALDVIQIMRPGFVEVLDDLGNVVGHSVRK